MRRFFVQNILFLLLVNLIVKPVWIFGVDIRVQNLVGHEAYGQYQTLLNLSIIFQILLDCGLQQYNNRTVARAPLTIKNLLPNMLVAKGFLSVLFLAALGAAALLMGYRNEALGLLLLLAMVQILLSLLLFLRSNISAWQHFKTDSLLSVFDRLLMIVFCSLLLWLPATKGLFTITWFVATQLIAYLITAGIALFYCLKLEVLQWKNIDLLKVWVIARHSFPYALLIFLMGIYSKTDVIIMERFFSGGASEAGRFAAASRLLEVANNMSGVLFAGILLPMFGRMLARREDTTALVRLSVNILLPLSLTTAIAGFFWGVDIMHFLYKDVTIYDGWVLTVLLFTFPGYCISYIYATLLTANGSIKPLIFISLLAVVLNLTANLIFTPRYGALSAASIAVGTIMTVSILNVVVASRITRLKQDRLWIFKFFLFILCIITCCWLLDTTGIYLVYRLILLGLITVIAMFISGLVTVKHIKEIWRKGVKFNGNNS